MDKRNADDTRQVSRERHRIPAPYHQEPRHQRAMHLSQHGLQHQPQPEKDSQNGRSPDSADPIRRPPQLGFRRQSQRNSPKRNQRRHGSRLRSNHPNLPRQPRHLRR